MHSEARCSWSSICLAEHDLSYISCRPEMKFDGINALISRIRTDAGIARKQLDVPMHQAYAGDTWLLNSH